MIIEQLWVLPSGNQTWIAEKITIWFDDFPS
jgi:hypothetical protein